MKRLLFAAALAAATVPALATDVGVSVSIGQPGFYGRLDIGGYPQPQVIYRRPIVVEGMPVDRPPVYLRVPPGHAKHWRKHCREYNACGERVYFVKDNWYEREYVPRYQEHHRDRRDERHDGQRDDHRGDQNDRHGDDHDSGRGH
ncbi:MAG: hypothetical protein H6R26_569 [Proteobacteria bacterium]|jgi:hypothetical protein|nr:hypothetical protein [Pseudomonadota bacterium]